MKRVVIYPGTFDPITYGHLDIITKASDLFEQVIIGVATSSRKATYFDLETRMDFCRLASVSFNNVTVAHCDGLLVDFAQQHHARYIIKGVRTSSDFDYETSMAQMNQMLLSNITTLFIPAIGEHAFVSATMVREILSLDGDVSAFVPQEVLNRMRR